MHTSIYICVCTHTYTHVETFKKGTGTGNGTVVASREGTSGAEENTFLFTVYFVVLLELFFNHEHALHF